MVTWFVVKVKVVLSPGREFFSMASYLEQIRDILIDRVCQRINVSGEHEADWYYYPSRHDDQMRILRLRIEAADAATALSEVITLVDEAAATLAEDVERRSLVVSDLFIDPVADRVLMTRDLKDEQVMLGNRSLSDLLSGSFGLEDSERMIGDAGGPWEDGYHEAWDGSYSDARDGTYGEVTRETLLSETTFDRSMQKAILRATQMKMELEVDDRPDPEGRERRFGQLGFSELLRGLKKWRRT